MSEENKYFLFLGPQNLNFNVTGAAAFIIYQVNPYSVYLESETNI